MLESATVNPERPPTYRFGPYEFDSHSGELRKFGHRLRLQGNSAQVLSALLEAGGDLVSREALQQKIWPADTFVDFEHGLNTAVAKLRQALSDSAASPRYVETLERRGYRFIAAVEIQQRMAAMAGTAAAVSGNSLPIASISAPQSPECPPCPECLPASPWRPAAMAAVALVLLAAGALLALLWQRRAGDSPAPQIHSVAVLPFKNLSGESSQEVLADGVTDGLITNLAQISSLRVISSTSVMAYKDSRKRLPEIARELKVDGVIEGTVQRSGDRVRVSVQLIDSRSDAHLWASEYEREMKDILTLQAEVVRQVAGSLRLLLTSSEQARLGSRTVVPAAYEAYVKGRSHWYKRWLGGETDLHTAGSYFEQAAQLDPGYAPAYSGLADYYAFLAIYGLRPPAECWPKSEQAMQRALQLDPDLAEAQISLAASRLYAHWDFAGAEQAADRALQLNPNYSEAHSFRSTLLATVGRFDESIASAGEAEQLDPVGQFGRNLLALARAHRFAQLERASREMIGKDPALGYGFLSTALLGQRREAEAFQARMKSLEAGRDVERVQAYSAAFPAGGYKAIARWELRKLRQRAREGYISPFDLASMYARSGDTHQALASLDSAFRERAPRMVFLQVDGAFDSIRRDPRFVALTRQVGLPPAKLE